MSVCLRMFNYHVRPGDACVPGRDCDTFTATVRHQRPCIMAVGVTMCACVRVRVAAVVVYAAKSLL